MNHHFVGNALFRWYPSISDYINWYPPEMIPKFHFLNGDCSIYLTTIIQWVLINPNILNIMIPYSPPNMESMKSPWKSPWKPDLHIPAASQFYHVISQWKMIPKIQGISLLDSVINSIIYESMRYTPKWLVNGIDYDCLYHGLPNLPH